MIWRVRLTAPLAKADHGGLAIIAFPSKLMHGLRELSEPRIGLIGDLLRTVMAINYLARIIEILLATVYKLIYP